MASSSSSKPQTVLSPSTKKISMKISTSQQNPIALGTQQNPVDLASPPVDIAFERGSSSSKKVCLHKYPCCSTIQLLNNYMNFKNSEIPSRFMYYSKDGSWVDFKEEVLRTLKSCFADKRPIIDIDINERCYIFDFVRMLQVDMKCGIQRSVAWIDDKGKCFFPKLFVSDEDSGVEGIEIDIKVDGNNLKRKTDEKAETDGDVITNKKRARVVGATCLLWPDTVLLKESDNEFLIVKNHLLAGLNKVYKNVDIVSVHQCSRTTSLGKVRWQLFQKQMDMVEKIRGKLNIVYAWFGRSAIEIALALIHGFGVVDVGHQYVPDGFGLRLSPIGMPQMSDSWAQPDEKGERHMLLCRIILGNVEKVNKGSMQTCPSNDLFDSGSDDPQNPKWFVVWGKYVSSHIYPECVVTYKASDSTQGFSYMSSPSRALANEIPSLVDLVLKIKDKIPEPHSPSLNALYEEVRANKMDQNAFLAQLRSLFGNDMLKAAAQQIREGD